MEKVNIKLNDECELKMPIESVKGLVQHLKMDEIVDVINENMQMDSLVERLCTDHPEKIGNLLDKFFYEISGDDPVLDEQHEMVEKFTKYLKEK